MFEMIFFAGLVILLLLVFTIFVLRKIKTQKRTKKFLKQWIVWAKKINRIPLWEHVSVIFLGLCISTICYLTLISILKPHFSMPSTTSINWYNVHHYPHQQDTFYFITSFSFITVISSIIWFIWIIQKSKK
jgi:hypothetical protein